MLKICIITEGNAQVGLGHISRCLSLYQAFQEKEIEPYFIIDGDSSVETILKGKKFLLFNWSVDFKRLLNEIKNVDIIIIDSYFLTQSQYNEIIKKVKLAVCIDDYIRLDYHSGIVINHLINAPDLSYPCYSKVNYLLGAKYCMLKKVFWETI